MASISLYNIFVFKHFVRFMQILHEQVTETGFSVLLQRSRYFLNPLLAFTPITPTQDPPSDAGGEGVVAFGLVSSAFSSDLLLPTNQIHASRLHRSKRPLNKASGLGGGLSCFRCGGEFK